MNPEGCHAFAVSRNGPWLESPAVFADFHNTLIAELSVTLNRLLPLPYYSSIGTADVSDCKIVLDRGTCGSGPNEANPALDVEPVLVPFEDDLDEWRIEVRTGEGQSDLVTSIEVLSRSNKRLGGDGRDEYRRKQRELRERGVNLVEFDLLRFGTHTTIAPFEESVRKAGPFDYHICSYRPGGPRDVAVYPIRLPQRLPKIEVPLRRGIPGIVLDVQTVFDRCYDTGLFARRLRYKTPCEPPLDPEQQSWAESVLREKGLM